MPRVRVSLFIFLSGISNSIDLVIAVDTATDASPESLSAVRNMLKNLLQSYNVTEPKTNIGLITYGRTATVKLPLSIGIDRSLVERAVDEIKTQQGPRDLERALYQARKMLLDIKRTDKRKQATKQVLLVVTGGRSDAKEPRLTSLARAMINEGIRPIVLAVGVTNAKDLSGLVKSEEDLIISDDAKKLAKLLGNVERRSGKAAGKLTSYFDPSYCLYYPLYLPPSSLKLLNLSKSYF